MFPENKQETLYELLAKELARCLTQTLFHLAFSIIPVTDREWIVEMKNESFFIEDRTSRFEWALSALITAIKIRTDSEDFSGFNLSQTGRKLQKVFRQTLKKKPSHPH